VPVHRSQRRSQQDCPDHYQNHRIGAPEVEITAAHLLQQKKYTDGNDHRGVSQATNGAPGTLAVDSITITHWMHLSIAPTQTVPEHENSYRDQNHRPKLLETPKREPVEVAQQQEDADSND
jgi:hypothetical protein